MSEKCGLIRDAEKLGTLSGHFSRTIPVTEGDRLSLLCADLIVRAALAREESRGSHSRTDFPGKDIAAHNITKVNQPVRFDPLN